MHLRQLRLKRALEARAVGVDARHAHRLAVRAVDACQQHFELLLQLFGAAPDGGNVGAAARRAGARHALGEAAVVAAQRAVRLVEHLVRAAVRAVAFPVAVGAVQHGRIAAPVEQHHALLAALHALLDGGQQRRGKHRAARLLAHVHHAQHRQAGRGGCCCTGADFACARVRTDAAGHVQAQVAPAGRLAGCGRAAGVPALERRRGRAQDDLGALFAPAPQSQVARRIARPFLLLVAGVVFFVDHDAFQARHGGKHRHARAQHDARLPAVRRQPALEPLRVRHAAVQRHHAGSAKALGKALFELRRQVDFRHHHQRLRCRVTVQRFLHRVQIHLGLAAAGAAKQQERAGVQGNLGSGALLLCAECYQRCSIGWRVGPGRCRSAQAPRQLGGVQVAQLRRQRGQRHLAQAALVVARGKRHQPAPVRVQRRNAVQHTGHGPQRGAFGHFCRARPHHAQHLALAQRHAHQRTRHQRLRAGIAQQLAQRTVGRGVHGHQYGEGRGCRFRHGSAPGAGKEGVRGQKAHQGKGARKARKGKGQAARAPIVRPNWQQAKRIFCLPGFCV